MPPPAQTPPMTDNLPLVRRSIVIGNRTWLVDTVDDENALLARAETAAQFPFGLMLWESAIALAKHLTEYPALVAGKSVLELGAGLGLTGVVAASLGACVTQTDHDASALTACQRTAALNSNTNITCQTGDWHDWRDAARYDVILGADIAYDGDDHAALLAVFDRALAPGGRILLADPGREKQPLFIARAQTAGWRVEKSLRRINELKPAVVDNTLEISVLELRRHPKADK